jgi:CheY-like chemotaxis protein
LIDSCDYQACATRRSTAMTVDLFMPRMDGLETIMALHRLAPETPVLAVSGSADWAGAPLPDLLTAAIAFGATTCLKKTVPAR